MVYASSVNEQCSLLEMQLDAGRRRTSRSTVVVWHAQSRDGRRGHVGSRWRFYVPALLASSGTRDEVIPPPYGPPWKGGRLLVGR